MKDINKYASNIQNINNILPKPVATVVEYKGYDSVDGELSKQTKQELRTAIIFNQVVEVWCATCGIKDNRDNPFELKLNLRNCAGGHREGSQ